MLSRVPKCFYLVFTLVVLPSVASSQSAPGTLTYTAKNVTYGKTCVVSTNYYTWTFTDPRGGKHDFPQQTIYKVQTNEGQPPNPFCTGTYVTSVDELSTDGVYELKATGYIGSVTSAP